MPSQIMDQSRHSLFYAPLPSSFSSVEHGFPTGKQVGFWKSETVSDHLDAGGVPIKPVASSPVDKKLQSLGVDSANAKSSESHQMHFYEEHRAKLNIENWRTERETSLLNKPWKPTDHDLGSQTNLIVQSSTSPTNGNKINLEVAHYESSLFSSSLSELFNKKVTLTSNGALFDKSTDVIDSIHGEDLHFESSEEIEARTIGNLLPDNDDLLEYIAQPNNSDDGEEDIFCSIGGMEIEEIDNSCCDNSSEVANGTTTNQKSELNSPFTGGHLFGENPSRILFVRNINSNVQDSELRDVFQQYGDIHTLYTACKDCDFVMVSYYDIRAAHNAMRELQNKPLKCRKLNIHFTVPKDNISEKDINQGTLMVFDLNPSVSNDDLCQIFGVYGEIMEIREAPNKHHKFIEFYDIRAAEAALHSLNRSDIAGKRIKLEPSCLGGFRWWCDSTQQFSSDPQQDDVRECQQQKRSPDNSPPEGFGSIPIGAIASNAFNLADVRGLQSVTQTPINSFADSTFSGLPSSVPCNFSPVRSASVSIHNNQPVSELGHSLGQRNFGLHCIPNFHPHSLPEYHENLLKGIPYNSNSLSSVGIDIAKSVGADNQHITIGSTGFGVQNFECTERAFGASGNGSYPLNGNQNGWRNSNSFHSPTGHVLWPNTPPFVNNIPCHPSSLLPGLPRTSHLLNASPHVPHHHVGSAPAVNPSIWNGCHATHAYAGDPVDAFHPGSLGSMGISVGSPLNPIELASRNIFSHIGGNYIEPPLSSLHVGLPSPQQRCHMYHSRNGMINMPSSFDAPNDRIRSRRNENNSNQSDNKRQYELDIDRIIRGEDSRTTLMIKNIPNKYTSKMLLAAIDELHRGTYDFIYLPIDFKNKCNVGYAFINMIDPQKIIPFHKTFNGKKWEKFNSEKVASLAYARIQGKAALIAHFQNSSLMNEDKRCRPILFHSDGPNAGDQEPFPMGVNIRSRPGRLRNHNSEDHHQDVSLCSANEEDNLNGMMPACGLVKDSD